MRKTFWILYSLANSHDAAVNDAYFSSVYFSVSLSSRLSSRKYKATFNISRIQCPNLLYKFQGFSETLTVYYLPRFVLKS